MTVESVMFALLRYVICGEQLDIGVKKACTAEMLNTVYEVAHKHDLAHLVGYALEQLQLPENVSIAKFKADKVLAIHRYIQLTHELKRICTELEFEKIPFIPLKGAVLREYYPEAWMRTSCDIDILVQEEMLDSVAAVMEQKLGYLNKGKSDHDISLLSPHGVHLELHYMAVDKGRFSAAQRVLSRLWEESTPSDNTVYCRKLSEELFYFYHIVHMAKHIENGGCGIRPFLDLWILNHGRNYHLKKRERLLKEGNLQQFASAAEKLSEIWFSNAPVDIMSQKLESYVLAGGTYGILENKICMDQVKLGGKTLYAIRKIFLPYDRLKYHYPVLQNHRFMTPFFTIIRWGKLLFRGGIRRSVHELRTNAMIAQENIFSTEKLLVYLGLKKG